MVVKVGEPSDGVVNGAESRFSECRLLSEHSTRPLQRRSNRQNRATKSVFL